MPAPRRDPVSPPPELTRFAEEYFQRLRGPVLGRVAGAADLTVSPDGTAVAFTAVIPSRVDADPRRRIAVLHLVTAELITHDPGDGESYRPSWSHTGDRLAWIAEDEQETWAEVGTSARPLRSETAFRVLGSVEYLQWSPDGGSLLLGIADPGADRADVHGSGRLPGATGQQSWGPEVSTGKAATGNRRACILDLASRSTTQVSPDSLTIWQAAWAGSRVLLCVVSDGPSESDWYQSQLVLIDTASGAVTPLHSPDGQVGQPAAASAGWPLSVLAGAMSDRGLYAGQLTVFPSPGAAPRVIDTAGADVTDYHWLDSNRVIFAGLRGLDTVIGMHTLSTGTTRVIWQAALTCGDLLPQIGAAAETVAAVVHSYNRPPAIARITGGAAEVLLDLAHPGTRAISRAAGSLEAISWQSADSRAIHGLLAVPDRPGPHPLVVHVHGGPVWAWRNAWSMHYPYTPLLVSRGYAVLHANHRGSLGHGQEFIRVGLHDMGGADAADLLTGIDYLVRSQRADPARIGITGNSYGGFMAAWLAATTDRFAAAVARSPVTDWISQHYTSNLPGFDRACFNDDPLDPASRHRGRSPLYLAGQVRTPVLLVAGALDLATPPEQAAMFHSALTEHGRDSTLVIYPEEGHGTRHHAATVDLCARILAFFERHMPVDS
jgi:dipeptidyl aminopeptidase/acylaminoacyl peptidase